ncbi:MAG: UDP-N-acetylglucosamine 4,6-dehydratase [Piscirickettsiaceae bacterium]|nr:MAG: UDP-N-acetylglucosamine 4,6-dehydratase [Piscirickettsiaceae bacterium]
MNLLSLVGRHNRLLVQDLKDYGKELDEIVNKSKFLVIGGAGSIGQEVVKQIFRRNPKLLHVIDISENNLAEIVRDLRSSYGYTDGETEFFPLDFTSREFDVFWQAKANYDYVLNLSALKHVRSDQFVFTLMRMINVNIAGTDHSMKLAQEHGVKKYFAVSSDKAKNPANLMGSTKCIMEDILFTNPYETTCSTARFANVAFSDGSLLHGFRQRLLKNQPISAPSDIARYFIIPEEAGELCLMSTIFGEHKDIFFPKENSEELKLTNFPSIARAYLEHMGYEAVEVNSEEEARTRVHELSAVKKWPCYFFKSDTSGEKPFEEFYADDDIVNWDRFEDIGIVKWQGLGANVFERTQEFLEEYHNLRKSDNWQREQVVEMIKKACPSLSYIDTGKFLSGRM